MKSQQIEEIEFKWTLRSESDVEIFLKKLPQLVSAISKPKTLIIRDYYLDTKSRFFGQCRTSCRLRNSDGRYELTLKSQSALKNGLASRQEKTLPLPPFKNVQEALDYCHKNILAPITGFQVLHILFEIHNQRNVRLIKLPEGTRCELSFDRARICRKAQSILLNEIELEFIRGNQKEFSRFIQKMTRLSQIPPARVSKVSTALSAFDLRADLQGAKTYAFTSFDTLNFAVLQSIQNTLETIRILEPQVRIGLYAEAVHQLRIALKKCQIVINIVKDHLFKHARSSIFPSFVRINRRLGQLREYQMHIQSIQSFLEKKNIQKKDASNYLSWAVSQKEKTYHQLLNEFNKPHYQNFLRHLKSPKWASHPESSGKLINFKNKILAKPAKKTLQALKNLCSRTDAAQLHTLRLRLKKFRYLYDFFEPQNNSSLNHHLLQWQSHLGKLQDIETDIQILNHHISSKKSTFISSRTKALSRRLICHMTEEKEKWRRKICCRPKRIQKLKTLIRNFA